MTRPDTVTLTRAEYDALVSHNAELEERVAALEADDGSRVPHEVAVAIMRGDSPCPHFAAIAGLPCATLPKAPGWQRAISPR